MKIVYTLTPELTHKIKGTFRQLNRRHLAETMAKLKELVEKEKPPIIISVGDVVSKNLHQYGITSTSYDYRQYFSYGDKQQMPPEAHGEKTVYVKNPQGTITEEAIAAIKEALAKERAYAYCC